MIIINEERKWGIHEIYITNLQQEVDLLHQRVNDAKTKIEEVEKELNRLVSKAKERFSKIENKAGRREVQVEQLANEVSRAIEEFHSVSDEIKSISESVIKLNYENKAQNEKIKEKKDAIDKLAEKDNRPVLLLIIILGASLMLSLGAKLPEIGEFLAQFLV